MYHSLLNKILLPLSDRFLGLSIQKQLKWWRTAQWLTAEELHQIQKERLGRLLQMAIRSCPYYTSLIRNRGIKITDDVFATLSQFPILDKRIIRNHMEDGILNPDRATYFVDHTSGSSGERGEFHFDRDAYASSIAIQSLWWEWGGYRFGDRVLQTGITPDRGFIKSIKDMMLRVQYVNAFQIDDKIMEQNLRPLRGSTDRYFCGYGSSLFSYAQFARSRSINDIRFKGVISWGDKMFPHYRRLIEEQFATEVFDCYGASEGLMIAAECNHHNYHIMTPHVVVELLNSNGDCAKPGELGEIIVTRLDNSRMPLIRYRIGDLAVLADSQSTCPCGRHLPMFEKIVGRDTDIIYTPGGKQLIVHFFTGIFEFRHEIQQFQVVQHSIDDIEVRYIPSSSFNQSTLSDIHSEIKMKSKEDFPIRFSLAEKIESAPSGKPQIVLSNMKFYQNDQSTTCGDQTVIKH